MASLRRLLLVSVSTTNGAVAPSLTSVFSAAWCTQRRGARAVGRVVVRTAPASVSVRLRTSANVVPPDTASAALGGMPWRVFPSQERIEAIDLLTFELGLYPEQRLPPPRHPQRQADEAVVHHTALTTSMAKAAAPSGDVAPTTTAPPQATKGSVATRISTKQKFASLDALNTRHTAPQGARAAAGAAAAKPLANVEGRAVPAAKEKGGAGGDVPTADIRPFTPFAVMQQLVADALTDARTDRRKRKVARVGRGGTPKPTNAKAASRRVVADGCVEPRAGRRITSPSATVHPQSLFSDEAAVLHRFGMGGRTDATAPGFSGLFRQRWQDFYVTEMIADPTAPLGGVVMSRELDFSIPPLPQGLLPHSDDGEAESRGATPDEEPSKRLSDAGFETEVDDAEAASSRDVGAEGPDPSFFEVDVTAHLADIEAEEKTASGSPRSKQKVGRGKESYRTLLQSLEAKEAALMVAPTGARQRHRTARFYLQCTLHKQRVAHSVALAAIAQTLRVHPRAISVAGIKDFIGDTVQRVRVENVSPTSALEANAIFSRNHHHSHHRPLRMTLSDFSYETSPLSPGDLFGNHFRIVLRDVTAPKSTIQDALTAFEQLGFPNYYGCQRFSWFAGREDAAFALLRHNWLAFAFRFLNFTRQDRSLRELLQRERKYPHAVQDEYRRNVVRRLRQIAVEPSDLDEAPFQSCPPLNETAILGAGGGPLNTRQELILWQLREAYFDLHSQSRRLTAQRLSSYLWNQVLTLRLHHFGGERVLDGDHVAPATLRRAASSVWDRKEWHQSFSDIVKPENRSAYTIADVVHPGFSFEGIRLPENPVGTYYEQVCDKYRLDWHARHTQGGITDFREPPRPIVRHPLNLSYTYDQAGQTLTLNFALERGCYANVAITELMKLTRCAGADAVTLLPLPDVQWEAMGTPDPGYVTALQDIYQGFEDGVGFTGDRADIDFAADSEKRIWEWEGPLFRPDHEDPFRVAHKWGSRHLLRNSERRESDRAAMRRQLFEAPLARKMGEEELASYAGHTVPMQPNTRGKRVFFKVLRRNQRYAGAPRPAPRLKRGAQKPNRSHKLPAFKTLNKGTWNVTW